MKWAIIGIVALVVLGGVGYAVYELTDAPEQAEAWWDEKRLDNFETIANRELDDFEEKIAEHEKTLTKLKADRLMWAGHPDYEMNEKEQDTGFLTKLGYESLIEHRSAQGRALAAAYKDFVNSDDVTVDADTGEPDKTVPITVAVPQKNGTEVSREMSAEEIEAYLGQLEEELIELEVNHERVSGMVGEYDQAIVEWENQIGQEKEDLVELRKEVKMIAAEIKLQKAKEDLAELNKAINGEESDSELGGLIHKYEENKSKFQREQLVAADEKAKESKSISLDDLDEPSGTSGGTTKSRFLN